MMKNNDLLDFSAKVLAKAVLDSFPSSRLIRAEKDDIGFVVDLFFPDPLHDQMVSFFEEKMREVLKDEKNIKIFEMMPENAIEYLSSLQKHDERAFENISLDSFQKMIKIGSFIDCCDIQHAENYLELLKFFHLYRLEKKEGILRIEGVAFFEKEKLKEKLKKIRSYKKGSHANIGVKEKYFLFDEKKNIILLDKAVRAKNVLEQFYKKNLQDFLFVETPYTDDRKKKVLSHIEVAKKYKSKKWPLKLAEKYTVLDKDEKISDSLFRYAVKEYFLETIFTDMELLESESISHLQFIEKVLKICGFNFEVDIQYPQKIEKIDSIMLSALKKSGLKYTIEKRKEKGHLVVFSVEDIKGRELKLLDLSAKSVLLANPKMDYNEKPKAMIIGSSLPEMHKLLALLLEMKGEKLSVFMMEMTNLLKLQDNKF